VHHESRDEGATPDMAIDLLWKVLSLELFVAIDFGFTFDNKRLDQIVLVTSIYINIKNYLATDACLAFNGRGMICIAFDAINLLFVREGSIV